MNSDWVGCLEAQSLNGLLLQPRLSIRHKHVRFLTTRSFLSPVQSLTQKLFMEHLRPCCARAWWTGETGGAGCCHSGRVRLLHVVIIHFSATRKVNDSESARPSGDMWALPWQQQLRLYFLRPRFLTGHRALGGGQQMS